MKLVIAEKPSVAQSLAAVLGAKERGQGYLQGNGYVVSWCVGHLIGLVAADAYDARYSKWCYEDLPIIPEKWKYTVAPDKKDQYEVLVSLINRPDVESLVCATDIEQREGRILRQGNQFKSVKIFKYVTEGTFDAYNWGLIENKQKFIGQLMSGKNPSRSCEDVDEAALSYAEVKTLASGDPRIMEKTELDGQVTKLKLLKANHESQRYALEDNLIKFYPQAIKREQEMIADLETDIRHLEAHTPPDKEHFSMTVMGTTYTEKKEAGQAIIAAFESLKDLSDKVELGEYRGFPMTLWVSDSGFSQKLQITLKHTRSHTIEPGSDPFGNITRMDNVLEGMRDNLEQHRAALSNLNQQMEDAKVEVKRPFPQEAELAEKSERLAALNVALNIGGKDKPSGQERQKRDGKTSIKRLLRRMGVESAASAAPKKDKEMEVAI